MERLAAASEWNLFPEFLNLIAVVEETNKYSIDVFLLEMLELSRLTR